MVFPTPLLAQHVSRIRFIVAKQTPCVHRMGRCLSARGNTLLPVYVQLFEPNGTKWSQILTSDIKLMWQP